MDKPKPYLTAALLCERVLQEKDGSLTIVRLADRIQYRIQGRGLPEGIRPAINIQGLLSLKSGPVIGEHTVKLVMEKPDGARKEILAHPVKFQGKDHGQNIILNMGVGIDQDGLYWFDVIFNDETLTRIPLMITPLEESEPQEQKT
jgi:hypothetical protein